MITVHSLLCDYKEMIISTDIVISYVPMTDFVLKAKSQLFDGIYIFEK